MTLSMRPGVWGYLHALPRNSLASSFPALGTKRPFGIPQFRPRAWFDLSSPLTATAGKADIGVGRPNDCNGSESVIRSGDRESGLDRAAFAHPARETGGARLSRSDP